MKVDSLKQLKALISLCRKQGIAKIEVDGIKLELGDAPAALVRNEATTEADSDKIDTGPEYSEMDTLLWSSTAHG